MPVQVLLAEDDAVLAAVLVEALTDDGHSVTHVPDVADAQRLAESASWDAFVCDSFGSFDELDTEERRALEALSARAPVILATGRSWAVNARASDIGVAAILSKPYDLDVLLATLQDIDQARVSTAPLYR